MSRKHDNNTDDDQAMADGTQTRSASSGQADDQSLEDLKQELEDVKNLASQMEAQLKRAVADYHNLEKRVVEGRDELAQWAASDLIKRLLPVLHSFDRVVEKGRPVLGERGESKDWFKGVEMAYKQLLDVLKTEGLDEIGADGQFDPALHEAVDTREPNSAEASLGKGENDILEVAQKGYTLNGKVLQPAKVVVGRK